MRSDDTDPWGVSGEGFPRLGPPAEKLRYALRYAILAPSGHNSQPWRFRIDGDSVGLLADRTRALPVVDPDDRELVMSCGAALFNLRVALHRFGHAPAVEVLPDPEDADLLARVRLGPALPHTPDDERLFGAIPLRRTNRSPFQERPVPEHILKDLETAARREGAWLRVIRDDEARGRLADLVADADRLQMIDKGFRRELASWIHPSRTREGDGMPGYSLGMGRLLDFAAPAFAFAMRTFDLGEGVGARDRQLAEGSPALAVLWTSGDLTPDWLQAGQALERVLLAARSREVWASFLNQPIEVEPLRPMVREMFDLAGAPQIILRLGHGKTVPPSPRRPLEDVLISE